MLSRIDITLLGTQRGQALTPQLNAGQALQITARILNADLALTVPTLLRYRVDDVISGQSIKDWTPIANASTATITLSSSYNTIRNTGRDFERRQIMVEASDSDGAIRQTQDYLLMNTLGSAN
jgi:hypothetical protein